MTKVLDVKSIIKLAGRHNKEPFSVMDECLIALVGLAGFNATELSLLQVKDLITERGAIAYDGYLPAQFNINEHERYFFIGENTYLFDCLQRYIAQRFDRKLEKLDRPLYAGLSPESYFFLKEDGSRFELNYKNRFEGDTLTQPLQMQRRFKSYFLGEAISMNTLNDSFIVNFWNQKSKEIGRASCRERVYAPV